LLFYKIFIKKSIKRLYFKNPKKEMKKYFFENLKFKLDLSDFFYIIALELKKMFFLAGG